MLEMRKYIILFTVALILVSGAYSRPIESSPLQEALVCYEALGNAKLFFAMNQDIAEDYASLLSGNSLNMGHLNDRSDFKNILVLSKEACSVVDQDDLKKIGKTLQESIIQENSNLLTKLRASPVERFRAVIKKGVKVLKSLNPKIK